jgi:gamma-glutamyltranspeptidase/glutathione hydrolase
MQALINLIDHGMSLQEAVEAPRVWTEGNALEVERAVAESVRAKLTAMGHKVQATPTVAGGMNASSFTRTERCRARPAGARTAPRSAWPAARAPA